MQIMQQQHQQCNNNDSTMQQRLLNKIQYNYALVPTEHQAPFVKVIIGLVRHQSPFVKVNRLVRRQAPFIGLCYAMTQLKCNDINIINSY